MKMTTEQQCIVENNHNLIYDFAKKRNVIIEEYYDILAIGLCKAALIYNKDIGEFSTIAYKCMETELGMHWRTLQSKKHIPDEKIVSYDAPVKNDDGEETSHIDIITDKCNLSYNLVDDVIGDLTCLFLMSLLTESERLIVRLVTNGLTQKQIADKLNCSQQNVYYNITKIRKKWSLYNN